MNPETALKAAKQAAMNRAGKGWNLIGDEFRNALIAQEVLRIISEDDEDD